MATKKKKRNRQKLSRFKHSPLINDPDFNIAEWAEEHGYTYAAVFNVLNGRTKNKRGEARQIAIDLGMLDENDQSAVFEVNGAPIDIANWAKEHGYPYAAVHGVVTGRTKNKRGRTREIAEKLGLVDKENSDQENSKPLPDNLAAWAKKHRYPYYIVYTVSKGNSKLTTPMAKKVAKELEKWQREHDPDKKSDED